MFGNLKFFQVETIQSTCLQNPKCHFMYAWCVCRVDISGKVDISELTWEQKERVLRFLFARINGGREKKAGGGGGGGGGGTSPPALGAPPHASSTEMW